MSDAQPAEKGEGFSLSQKLQSTSVKTMTWILRVTNFINACLLLLSGLLALIDESLTIILVITAIYVASFASCLLCFEFRLSFFERVAFTHFGFMFSTWGRASFFIFISIMTISFNSVVGYVAFSYTLVNMIWNVYCMHVHEEYSKWLAADNTARKLEAARGADPKLARDAAKYNIPLAKTSSAGTASPPAVPPKPKSSSIPDSAFDDENPKPTSAASASNPADWEKLFDENTKLYYYHNHKTGETRWEEP